MLRDLYIADAFVWQVLYVMELQQDLEKGKATFTALSEFLLTHPVLSFGVRDVAHSRLRHTEVLPAEEESESKDPFASFKIHGKFGHP